MIVVSFVEGSKETTMKTAHLCLCKFCRLFPHALSTLVMWRGGWGHVSRLRCHIESFAAYTHRLHAKRNVWIHLRETENSEVSPHDEVTHRVKIFSKHHISDTVTLSALSCCYHEKFFLSLLFLGPCCHDNSVDQCVHCYLSPMPFRLLWNVQFFKSVQIFHIGLLPLDERFCCWSLSIVYGISIFVLHLS